MVYQPQITSPVVQNYINQAILITMNKAAEDTLRRYILFVARKLIDELRYDEYPKEWSTEPLASLLPVLYELFGSYSSDLRDTIKEAIEHHSVDRLQDIHASFFKKDDQYFRDEALAAKPITFSPYWAEDFSQAPNSLSGKVHTILQAKLAPGVIDCFAQLKKSQENEHRTLEHLVHAIEPLALYLYSPEITTLANDMIEYADYWRELPDEDREAFANKVKSYSA